jgi:hypothetical protein
MPRLRNAGACNRALDAAMEWLKPLFGKEDDWSAASHPLLTYHKVPYLMAVRGHSEDCRRALIWIKANLMTREGDLLGAPRQEGQAPVPAHTREKCWVAAAAHLTGRYDISFPAACFQAAQQGRSTGGVYNVDAAGRREETAEVRATAIAGALFTMLGDLPRARLAARFLARAIELQSEQDRFFLHMDEFGRAASRFPRELAATRVITTASRGPQLSYLAMPVVFLTRLHLATGEPEWLDAAMDYYAFTQQFREEATLGEDSAALAWAAATLYGVTRRRAYYDAAERVVESWIGRQRSDGSWRKSRDEEAAIALTAQTAVCLFECLREAQ